jgi:hypothetical protein
MRGGVRLEFLQAGRPGLKLVRLGDSPPPIPMAAM